MSQGYIPTPPTTSASFFKTEKIQTNTEKMLNFVKRDLVDLSQLICLLKSGSEKLESLVYRRCHLHQMQPMNIINHCDHVIHYVILKTNAPICMNILNNNFRVSPKK